MSLMAMFEKALNSEVATAIPAIPAIESPRIATIAPIAVAQPTSPKNEDPFDPIEMIRQDRVITFESKGIESDTATWLAEKLTTRDMQMDDRRSCAECSSFYGNRCIQHRQPFGGGGVEVLHRCKGFKANQRTRLELEFGFFYNDS
ncbi:hypothetical protein [Pusillimonas sp. ANT_WB101]|uniref:hypothetical protein n=1 Tax=Pusillimonas sp. ANT_WB101 TaxID=2597356 RepID=UPI0011ED7160|nr:hypothetical protein [Pusillimonas sp. ANT_WB101]KAA0893067.1 hypothetical protein FQ179_12515 [Pusillimonas sp. ANT_WB101]